MSSTRSKRKSTTAPTDPDGKRIKKEMAETPSVYVGKLGTDGKKRCGWAPRSAEELEYHDKEWGVPLHDDRKLFEFLVLEGAQAGLSWTTIMRKRDGYRNAFENFDIAKVAAFDAKRIEKLLEDPGIVRNKAKVNAAVGLAKICLGLQKEFGSLDAYLWRFVDDKPIVHTRKDHSSAPKGCLTTTEEAEALSADLKRRGAAFVGPTIMYAFMQAVGMVNDHLDCYLAAESTTQREDE